MKHGVLFKYKDFLPVTAETPLFSLGEGDTPLVRCQLLEKATGCGELTEKHPVTLVNSVNPHRIDGQKTAAFEIVDSLGDAPDYLFIPVGNAGNITAYWQGFTEYYQAGKASRRPRMMGFQAEGAAPIVRGHTIEEPETVASAIRIGNPASWQKAVTARDESGGIIGKGGGLIAEEGSLYRNRDWTEGY